VVYLEQNVLLKLDVVKLLILHYDVLPDALHGVYLLVELVLHHVDLPEGALADHAQNHEILKACLAIGRRWDAQLPGGATLGGDLGALPGELPRIEQISSLFHALESKLWVWILLLWYLAPCLGLVFDIHRPLPHHRTLSVPDSLQTTSLSIQGFLGNRP
jgi:hypothetical protein